MLSLKRILPIYEKSCTDLECAHSEVLVCVGDKLGLYKAMLVAGKPIISQELAIMTKTFERDTKGWLADQAAVVIFSMTHKSKDILTRIISRLLMNCSLQV